MTAPGRQLTLDAVDVGWVIASTRRASVALADQIGGVVVEVIRTQRTDPETGEIEDRTLYRCLDWARRWQTIDAREVDLDRLYGLDRSACHSAGVWFWKQINPKRKTYTPDEVDAIRYMWALTRAAA